MTSVWSERRPVPIVLVKCWKIAYWSVNVAKKLPKIQNFSTQISKVAT